MNRSCMSGLVGVFMLLGWVTAGQADYINHDFETAPFTNGATFMAPVLQWQASAAGVTVVNTKAATGLQSVYVPGGSALSNAVAVTNPSVVWTQFRIAPFLGAQPDANDTNGVTYLQYFGSNGYLNVLTGGGWVTCSNDVWGQPVVPATNGVFVDVAIYQNFTSRTAAVLLNDQVVVQDLPFLGSSTNYGSFRTGGSDSNAWLDDVYIQATCDSARSTHDRNGDGTNDANELQSYGYVARTLYVGTGPGYPGFPTIQAALNAWRARDPLYVYAGQYAEDVTLSNSVTFGGQAFTNSGSLTIGAGLTVAFQGATAWSNIAVGANSVVTFNQPLACSNLFVAANASVTFGGSVALGSATVFGSVLATGSCTVTVTTALSVPTNGSGHLDFAGGRLTVPSSGVDMTGTFSITNTWGTQATATLNFSDSFELYAADSQMANLGFQGWGASSTGVLVKAGQGVGSSKAAVVPDYSMLSNRIASVGQPRIWTDYYIKPVLGVAPLSTDTNSYTFMSFVGTNGLLNVWKSGAWAVCSNYVNGSAVTTMDTGSFTRVTVFLNFGSHLAAVFVAGKLVYEQVPFPAGAAIPSYNSFQAASLEGSTYLDNITIGTNIPADLLSVDLDNDGIPDALEIQRYDSLLAKPVGTIFTFR